MIITAWILFVILGFITLALLRKFIKAKLNIAELILFLFSLSVSSISAGFIWGGLFR